MPQIECPINWHDSFSFSEYRTVMTQEQLQIPGLRTFGWHDMKTAAPALKSHYHENAVEITFATHGQMVFSIGTEETTMHGGDAFYTLPNVIHSTNEIPMSVGEICWIQLDISDPNQFLFLRRDAAESLIRELLSVRNGLIHTDNGFCTKVLKKIIRDILEEPSGYSPQRISCYILVYLHTLLEFTRTASSRITPDIQRVCDYISMHICEELPLEKLAKVSNLSLSQFKNKFNNQIGVPPARYVSQLKIDTVKPLLRAGCSITDLSASFGFCDSSYFASVFKKFTGLTPSQYIRQNMALSEQADQDTTV